MCPCGHVLVTFKSLSASILAERASTRPSLDRPATSEVSGRERGPLLTMVPREETAVIERMESLDSFTALTVGISQQ